MEEEFIGKNGLRPRRVKSLMWYVGYIIAAGVTGVAVMLLLMEVVFV